MYGPFRLVDATFSASFPNVNSAGRRLESWLPVVEDGTVRGSRPVYVPPTQSGGISRVVVTAVLLVLVSALVVARLRVGRCPDHVGAPAPERPLGP